MLEKTGNADFWPAAWGPPHDEPFWATRQQATTRGEATSGRGGLALTCHFPEPSGLLHQGWEATGSQRPVYQGCLASFRTELAQGQSLDLRDPQFCRTKAVSANLEPA